MQSCKRVISGDEFSIILDNIDRKFENSISILKSSAIFVIPLYFALISAVQNDNSMRRMMPLSRNYVHIAIFIATVYLFGVAYFCRYIEKARYGLSIKRKDLSVSQQELTDWMYWQISQAIVMAKIDNVAWETIMCGCVAAIGLVVF